MEGGRRVEAGSSASSDRRDGSNDILAKEKEVEVDEKELVKELDDDDDDDYDDDGDFGAYGFIPSPLVPLKEHLERDKDDESLRRWKEMLLGCVEEELIGQMEPEVTFHSIEILSEGCEEMVIPLPVNESQTRVLFTLKEGSHYRLKLTFSVQHNIVSGLTYLNTVWKGRHKVDQTKGMLGTFAPRREPYEEMLNEEKTPSGFRAQGIYSAKLKFEDDDKRCYLDLNYSFEIKKS